ncbi:MAG: hypothetical protein SGBAC_005515 [Bacillariaceae sp.]
MPSLHMQGIQEGEKADPPFPSLRALDFDLADLWCHSLLAQPLERNVEALFEELEKIIPRLTPLNISDEDDANKEDVQKASNNDAAKAMRTEQSVGIRMRMLEVWQDVLTLEFQEDDAEGSETQTSTPSPQLIFTDPSNTSEGISILRKRLQLLFEKLKIGKERSNDDGYHRLRRSLLAVEEVLDFEARLTSRTNQKWLGQLSENLKTLTKTFLDNSVPVPDALASIGSFVLELVVVHRTESPPSPSPLTQDSAIADDHDDSDQVTDEDIAKVQQGLCNLYSRPASPFYIVQLQEEVRQLLLNWSTNRLEIPKLVRMGYLTGKQVTTCAKSPPSSSDGEAMDYEKENGTGLPQNGSDSETTLGDGLHKKKQSRTSEVVGQICGSSKTRRNTDTIGVILSTGYMEDESEMQRASPHKQKRTSTSNTKRKDPSAKTAPMTSPPRLKSPPHYPSQAQPANSKKPTSSQIINAEDEDRHKRGATYNKQVTHRRSSGPTRRTRIEVRKKPSAKRSLSHGSSIAKKEVRKKQKRKPVPTEEDVLEEIRQGIATYGYGNWTMIQKRSGGILKHLTGSQIKEVAEAVTAVTV